MKKFLKPITIPSLKFLICLFYLLYLSEIYLESNVIEVKNVNIVLIILLAAVHTLCIVLATNLYPD